jgi:hypothetical protein
MKTLRKIHLLPGCAFAVIMAFNASNRAWLIWIRRIGGLVVPVILLFLERGFH